MPKIKEPRYVGGEKLRDLFNKELPKKLSGSELKTGNNWSNKLGRDRRSIEDFFKNDQGGTKDTAKAILKIVNKENIIPDKAFDRAIKKGDIWEMGQLPPPPSSFTRLIFFAVAIVFILALSLGLYRWVNTRVAANKAPIFRVLIYGPEDFTGSFDHFFTSTQKFFFSGAYKIEIKCMPEPKRPYTTKMLRDTGRNNGFDLVISGYLEQKNKGKDRISINYTNISVPELDFPSWDDTLSINWNGPADWNLKTSDCRVKMEYIVGWSVAMQQFIRYKDFDMAYHYFDFLDKEYPNDGSIKMAIAACLFRKNDYSKYHYTIAALCENVIKLPPNKSTLAALTYLKYYIQDSVDNTVAPHITLIVTKEGDNLKPQPGTKYYADVQQVLKRARIAPVNYGEFIKYNRFMLSYFTRIDIDYDSAQAYLDKLIEPDAKNASYLTIKADIFRAKGDFSNADLFYRRSLSIRPDDWITTMHYGFNFKNLGKLDSAEECFLKGLNMHVNDGDAMNYIAGLYEIRKDYKKSLKWLKKSLILHLLYGNSYPEDYFDEAKMYYALEDTIQSKLYLDSARDSKAERYKERFEVWKKKVEAERKLKQ